MIAAKWRRFGKSGEKCFQSNKEIGEAIIVWQVACGCKSSISLPSIEICSGSPKRVI